MGKNWGEWKTTNLKGVDFSIINEKHYYYNNDKIMFLNRQKKSHYAGVGRADTTCWQTGRGTFGAGMSDGAIHHS